jgi:hypothetical protein
MSPSAAPEVPQIKSRLGAILRATRLLPVRLLRQRHRQGVLSG